MDDEEILIETTVVGHALRVAAIHPRTLTEIVFQAPQGTSALQIERLAAAKLERALARRETDDDPGAARGRVPARGTLV